MIINAIIRSNWRFPGKPQAVVVAKLGLCQSVSVVATDI